MSRILVLLPTRAYRADDFLAAARALGAEIVVASDRPQALGGLMEARAITLDYARPEEAVERISRFAKEHALDAVVPVDDDGVVIAALAAERLGLPHNPPAAALAATDKVAMREALDAAGVPQPDFLIARFGDEVGRLADALRPPVVVKAPSLSMSRGVIRADSPEGAAAAATAIRRILDAAGEDVHAPLLVERFVPGEEVAVEGLLRGWDLEVLALFDKPDPLDGPIFAETIYVTPSRHPEEMQAAVRGLVARACAALGLREGPVHAEVRLSPEGPILLEVAGRSIGGLCSRSLRFGAGVSLEELILRHALGTPTEGLVREDAASGVLMLPVPREGTLVEVRGQDAARDVRGIEGVVITVHRGDRLVPLPEGDRYLGFVFARGATPEEVEAALREADRLIEPVLS